MANDTPEADRLNWPAGTAKRLRDLEERNRHWVFKYVPARMPVTGGDPSVPMWTARLRGHLFGAHVLEAESPEELQALIEIADTDPPKPFVSAF